MELALMISFVLSAVPDPLVSESLPVTFSAVTVRISDTKKFPSLSFFSVFKSSRGVSTVSPTAIIPMRAIAMMISMRVKAEEGIGRVETSKKCFLNNFFIDSIVRGNNG